MKNIFDLSNKAVVVFGCGCLGAPTVKAMLELGAKVVVADLHENMIRINLGEYSKRKECIIVKCDLRKQEDIIFTYEKCKTIFGFVNGSINLAHYGSRALLDELDEGEFNDGIEGGLTHVFRTTKLAIPYLEKNGGGSIINTSSMYGVVTVNPNNYIHGGNHNPPTYGAAKAAVIMFSKYCASHLALKNIRVNCVSPGPFPMKDAHPDEFIEILGNNTMLGRVGNPEEIAGAYCYLVSDASSYVTGTNIIVDGGWTAW